MKPSSKNNSTDARRFGPWLWVSLAFVLVLAIWVGGDLLRRRLAFFPTSISPAQAYQAYRNGQGFFLDVRESSEYGLAHIPKSMLSPSDQLKWRLGELPKDGDIIIICPDGVRHDIALNLLRQSGFPHSACLAGGIAAWQAAGYPVEKY